MPTMLTDGPPRSWIQTNVSSKTETNIYALINQTAINLTLNPIQDIFSTILIYYSLLQFNRTEEMWTVVNFMSNTGKQGAWVDDISSYSAKLLTMFYYRF